MNKFVGIKKKIIIEFWVSCNCSSKFIRTVRDRGGVSGVEVARGSILVFSLSRFSSAFAVFLNYY